MRAMDGRCALGHSLSDNRLTLRRSMRCWSAHAVSLRDACKAPKTFVVVNVAAPRSSVKMCEKPARSPLKYGFERQFGAYYGAAGGPMSQRINSRQVSRRGA